MPDEKTQVKAQTWLYPRQVDKLLNATDRFATHLQMRNEVAILLMYDTGIRVGELVSLDVDNVRLDRDPEHIYLRPEQQKRPPDGSMPDAASIELTDDLGTARLLRHYLNTRWKDADALLPSQKSGRMGTEQVRNVVRKASRRAGVRPYLSNGDRGEPEQVTPHTLRHSVFTRMFVEGDDRMKDVSLRLRHGSITTTERIYSHVTMR